MTNTILPTMSIQVTIENLLRATGREHVEELLAIMRNNGYYRAGCRRHHQSKGGLAQHSMEVLMRMQRSNDANLPVSSLVIVALLHDLCNIRGFKQYRHHGSRSVLIATREAGFKLYPMEYQAILWHMHRAKEKGTLGAQFDEVLANPLWHMLRKADGYSAAHPMTRQDFMLAMSGKPRRKKSSAVIEVSERSSAARACVPKAERPISAEAEMHSPRIRRTYSSYRDQTNALMQALKELNMEDSNKAIEILFQKVAQRTPGPIVQNPHFKGFNKEYLRTASYEEIEYHRTLLMDRCQYKKCAAKYAASYIYSETNGVFNIHLETDDMHNWLKEEFNTTASLAMFYKERPQFDKKRI